MEVLKSNSFGGGGTSSGSRKTLSFDFCNVLIRKSPRKFHATRFMYFKSVPIVLNRSPILVSNFVAKFNQQNVVSGNIDLIDGYAIFLHSKTLRDGMGVQALFHELGHVRLKHYLIPKEDRTPRLGLVNEGVVDAQELEADEFACRYVGKEKYLTFLDYLGRETGLRTRHYQERFKNVNSQEGPRFTERAVKNLESMKLSEEEIRLRIEHIQNL